jgi:hypothetical protein
MKKIIPLFLIALTSYVAHAQDIITKNDSSQVKATVIEVNPTEVKYKLFNYEDGPKITIRKDELAYIIYKNGMVERFAKTRTERPNNGTYNPNKYNLDNVPVKVYTPEEKTKNCEKLYAKKNYLGFNYITFLNSCLGFNYMRDIKKANLIINVPFAFGVGSPAITNSLYRGNFLDGTSSTRYDLLKYQVGLNILFAPSMTREVNFLMGPSFNFSDYNMSVDTRYSAIVQNQYYDGRFINKFSLRREHYGINLGFLARFTERINMNMLITFGYKKDSYSEKDPYGIYRMNENGRYQVRPQENVMPYVNFSWSVGYRF